MPTVHASAVLAGARAVLIRGASGAGKSRLALGLLQAAAREEIGFARLVGDDRISLSVEEGHLLCRPAQALAGLIEVRGLGIVRVPYEPVAVVGLVVDLGDEAAERLPTAARSAVNVDGVFLPRVAFPPCADPLPMLLAALRLGEFRGLEQGSRCGAKLPT